MTGGLSTDNSHISRCDSSAGNNVVLIGTPARALCGFASGSEPDESGRSCRVNRHRGEVREFYMRQRLGSTVSGVGLSNRSRGFLSCRIWKEPESRYSGSFCVFRPSPFQGRTADLETPNKIHEVFNLPEHVQPKCMRFGVKNMSPREESMFSRSVRGAARRDDDALAKVRMI